MNPYPSARLKAQKINQSGQLLWGENGVYLSDTFSYEDPAQYGIDYNGYDELVADGSGGAYYSINYDYPQSVNLLKISSAGSVTWQNQLSTYPRQSVMMARTYPNGFYIFAEIMSENNVEFIYRRYTDNGEMLFNRVLPFSFEYQTIHVFSDNSFLIKSGNQLQKYSGSGTSLWTVPATTNSTIVLSGNSEFYLVSPGVTPENHVSIQKYNTSGQTTTNELTLPTTTYSASGLNSEGKLVVLTRSANLWKIITLNHNNTIQFSYQHEISFAEDFFDFRTATCFLNNSIVSLSYYHSRYTGLNYCSQFVSDYQGYGLQRKILADSGPNHHALEVYNQQYGDIYTKNFFADANGLTLFQQSHYMRIYKLDSEGNSLFPPAGKRILEDYAPSINKPVLVHETPANHFILVYNNGNGTLKGFNLNNLGETNFTYESMHQYVQFINRPDCIWALYRQSDSYDYYAHRLINETTFEANAASIGIDKELYKVCGKNLLFRQYSATDNLNFLYLQNLTDNLTLNTALPAEGLHVASIPQYYRLDFKAQQTSQNLLLSWNDSSQNIDEFRIQIVNTSNNTLVFPTEGYLFNNNQDLSDFQIYSFENNIFDVLYLDDSNGQHLLKLQKYNLENNNLISLFPDGGITVSDTVSSFTAEKFANSLAITYVRGFSDEEYRHLTPPSFITRFINDNNDLTNQLQLESYTLPQLYPIDEQNTYVVWSKGSPNYFNKSNAFFVQKVNITQLPVNDQTISPSLPLSLSQNYPNPFNPETTISFSLPVESKVKLEIYNIKGQKVTTLLDEQLGTGKYNITWKGTNSNQKQVSSGIYFYKLSTPDKSITRKMLLMK